MSIVHRIERVKRNENNVIILVDYTSALTHLKQGDIVCVVNSQNTSMTKFKINDVKHFVSTNSLYITLEYIGNNRHLLCRKFVDVGSKITGIFKKDVILSI